MSRIAIVSCLVACPYDQFWVALQKAFQAFGWPRHVTLIVGDDDTAEGPVRQWAADHAAEVLKPARPGAVEMDSLLILWDRTFVGMGELVEGALRAGVCVLAVRMGGDDEGDTQS